MIVYQLGPIDDWDAWTPHVAKDERDMQEFAEVCYLAATLGWEGDIREGPFTTMLRDPDDRGGSSTRAIAFKQDNNGVTFVAVHSALHWLFREYGGSAVVTWHPPIRPPPVMATHDRIIALERPRCRGIAGAIGV